MPRRPINRTRLYGMLTAATLGGFFLVLIGLFVLRAERRAELGLDDLTVLGADEDTGLTVQLTDRETGRLTGELSAERVEPLPDGRSRLIAPTGLVFLASGGTIHVRADEGEFLMPGRAQAPESGTLSGDVVVRFYDAADSDLSDTADRSPFRPDPDRDDPDVTFRSDAPLSFDMRLLEARTDGRITAIGDRFEIAGRGLFVALNEVRERVERLQIAEGEYVTVELADRSPAAPAGTRAGDALPPARDPADPASDRVDAPAPALEPANPSPPQEPPLPDIVRYAITVSDQVRLTVASGAIEADRLDAWVRLEDNQLAPGALAELASFEQDGSRPETGIDRGPAGETDDEQDAEPRPASAETRTDTGPSEPTPAGSGPSAPAASSLSGAVELARQDDAVDPNSTLLMTWSGPLELVPVTAPPPSPLGEEDVAVRFVGDGIGRVRADDVETGVRAVADTVDYGATTGSLAMWGVGPRSVRVDADGVGRLWGGRLEADGVRGTARVVGLGELVADRGDERPARIAWNERADFASRAIGGGEAGRVRLAGLETAEFFGGVRLFDRDASLHGQSLRVRFAEQAAQTGSASSNELRLVSTVANGREGRPVVAADGSNGAIASSRLDVTFDPATGQPQTLAADGAVRFTQRDAELFAENLIAGFEPDPEDEGDGVRLRSVTARGDVEFADHAEDLIAFADTLDADAVEQTVRLRGDRAPARIGRGSTSIEGPDIELRDGRRAARVNGAGVFRHVEPPTDAESGATIVQADWGESMSFDDLSGVIECLGEANVDITSWPSRMQAPGAGPIGRDTLAAHRLRLELDPTGTPEESGLPAATGERRVDRGPVIDEGPLSEGGERGLRRVLAFGAPDGGNATLESRRFAASDHARHSDDGRDHDGHADDGTDTPIVEQLVYLEGATIIGDQSQQTLDVPSAGRLLILDRRESEWDAATALRPGTRDALLRMDWSRAMLVDRAQGFAWLEGETRVRHKRLSTDELFEIDADRVTTRFSPLDTAAEPLAREGGLEGPVELRSVRAIGRVYASQLTGSIRTSEMVADQLRYDPATGLAEAIAAEGRRATFLSVDRPTPLSAERLRWELDTGRVDVVDPGIVGTPD